MRQRSPLARTVVLVVALLAPFPAACAGGLHTHARLAALSGELIDAAGAEIEREAQEDADQIRDSDLSAKDVATRMDALQETFEPLEAAYSAAKNAHASYVAAIWAALERGEDKLGANAGRALLSAWRALAEVGDAVGVNVPSPPPALVQAIGGEP